MARFIHGKQAGVSVSLQQAGDDVDLILSTEGKDVTVGFFGGDTGEIIMLRPIEVDRKALESVGVAFDEDGSVRVEAR
jgi:hypothetical protein